MWTKYDYVCSDCDALIEITTLQNIKEWRGWCPCGSPNITNISINDATVKVNPIDHTKQAPIKILLNKYKVVTKNTPAEVVKINTNPYN
jgi:hypothetical protein